MKIDSQNDRINKDKGMGVRKMSNMRLTSLNSSIGTAKYPANTEEKVLIAIEDTGYAFNFYRDYLKRNFTIANADIVGIGGANNFSEALEERVNYDAYIIIYDRGAELRKLLSIRNALETLKEENASAAIYLFTPNCFEEILLSFSLLDSYVQINCDTDGYAVHQMLQELIHGKVSSIEYSELGEQYLSTEQKIERYLEEVTENTVFEYKHTTRGGNRAKMSDCWVYNCCQVDATVPRNIHVQTLKENCRKIPLGKENNKLAVIANYSLLGGLTNIIMAVFGYNNELKLQSMHKETYAALVGRVI